MLFLAVAPNSMSRTRGEVLSSSADALLLTQVGMLCHATPQEPIVSQGSYCFSDRPAHAGYLI